NLSVLITGADAEYKADLFTAGLFHELGGVDRFDDVSIELVTSGHADPQRNSEGVSRLLVTFKSAEERVLGRPVFDAVVSLALSSFAGFTMAAEGGRTASAYGVHWPTLLDRNLVDSTVVLPDGTIVPVEDPPTAAYPARIEPDPAPVVPLRMGDEERVVPLGTIIGGRSGDKGGNANVGLFARSEAGWLWLQQTLTVERMRELLPEAAGFEIVRYDFPKLW